MPAHACKKLPLLRSRQLRRRGVGGHTVVFFLPKFCVFLVTQLLSPLMDLAAITAHIELNPQVRFGKPVVKGTRTTVAEVLEMLANDMSAADIEEDFPAIGPAQVRACLLYAAYKESVVLLAAA